MAERVARSSPYYLFAGMGCVGLVLGLVVAGAPLVPLLLGLGGAAAVVVTFYEPLMGLGVALLLGPLRAWLEIRSPGLLPQIGQVFLALVLASWIGRGLLRRDLRISVPLSFLPLAVFIVVALLSLWAPVSEWAGTLELLKWGQILLVAVLVYDRLSPRAGQAVDSRWALGILAVSALFQAGIGLWQFGLLRLGSLVPIEVKEFAINDRFSRAYGSFQQPNPYGGFLGLVGALLVGITVSTLVDRWRSQGMLAGVTAALWTGVPALVVVAGLVASWSRGGWMGFAAAVAAMAALLPRRGWWGPVLLAGVVGLGALLLATGRLPDVIANRLVGFLEYTRFEDIRGVGVTDANFAVMERMAHWQAALGMWRDRFWLGVGLGGYEPAYPAYRLINWALPLGHAHNTYLNMLAEVGLLGCVAYLGWLGLTGLGLVRALRSGPGRGPLRPDDSWQRGVTLGLIGAWTHFAVHSLVDSLLVNNVHLHVGVLVALGAWCIVTGTKENTAEPGRQGRQTACGARIMGGDLE